MAKPALPSYARSSRGGQTRSWALGTVDSGSECTSHADAYNERYEPELAAKIAFVRETLEEYLTPDPSWQIVRSKVLANRQVHARLAHAAGNHRSTCYSVTPTPRTVDG
jgi:hypothetical protein